MMTRNGSHKLTEVRNRFVLHLQASSGNSSPLKLFCNLKTPFVFHNTCRLKAAGFERKKEVNFFKAF